MKTQPKKETSEKIVPTLETEKTAAELLIEIESLETARSAAGDFIGKEFNILNASYGQIKDTRTGLLEDVVNFKIHVAQTGEVVTVAKALTVFTDPYPKYFAKGGTALESRTFVVLENKRKPGQDAPVTIRKFGGDA